jgi:toxin ParE1/3/4
MRVIVLSQAEEDISESALFIAEDTLDSALHFIESTKEAFEFLSRHPEVGSNHAFMSPTLSGTKSWPISGFENRLVFYRIRNDEIVVIRVLHGARNIDKLP